MSAAPAASPPGAAEPDGAPRIAALDILRGVAILGILFMNVNDMAASFNYPDIRQLGWTAADRMAWWTRAILADGTARAMLEMLFGAGMVILTDRVADAAGMRIAFRRYYWRNIVLWLFGLVHMFVLLWPGDILHTYGIAALIVFWFRRLPPRWLIAIGLIGAVANFVGAGVFGNYLPYRERAEVAAIQARQQAGHMPDAAERKTLAASATRTAEQAAERRTREAMIAAENRARSSTTANWVRESWTKSIARLSEDEFAGIWEAAGTMLIGAALFKLGILQGERSRTFYCRLLIFAYALSLPLRAFAAYEETRFDDLPQLSWMTYEFARLGTTLGHVAAICLIVGTAAGARMFRPFVAAGRTALTLYVLQTIACLWVLFPPFALALYGKLGWMEMMLVSAGVDLGLLWLANVWLRHFRIAPVEWAWRSIVEGRRLPFRRAAG